MATQLKNLSTTSLETSAKDFKKIRIALVVAEWNNKITFSMMNAAIDFLVEKGVKEKNIEVKMVPGAFELPLGAQLLAAKKETDAVIVLGCVIQGETRHFDFICDACANGIMNVG